MSFQRLAQTNGTRVPRLATCGLWLSICHAGERLESNHHWQPPNPAEPLAKMMIDFTNARRHDEITLLAYPQIS
jgi:hypothetical protein